VHRPQALAERDMSDPRGEQRVVDLLAVPLESYDVVTVSVLSPRPDVICGVWQNTLADSRGFRLCR
jgi:hypothetical protein